MVPLKSAVNICEDRLIMEQLHPNDSTMPGLRKAVLPLIGRSQQRRQSREDHQMVFERTK
jgi:hypothetical protein